MRALNLAPQQTPQEDARNQGCEDHSEDLQQPGEHSPAERKVKRGCPVGDPGHCIYCVHEIYNSGEISTQVIHNVFL